MAKNKIIRFLSIEADRAFDREAELIAEVQRGELAQALMLWQSKTPTLILPAGKKWRQSPELNQALSESGWQLVARKTGGAPVPQCAGIINLSHIYHLSANEDYNIQRAYVSLCEVLIEAFSKYGVKLDIHATPYSYCDGDYNLNIAGRKLIGTAQRVLLSKGGARTILAQACIIVEANVAAIVEPVVLTNALCEVEADIRGEVHTSLSDHVEQVPEIDSLYQNIAESFVRLGKRK